MKFSSQQEQRYRLTASNVAEYFRHRCDGHARLPLKSAEDGDILLSVQWKGF
jgi:hypothetical protein